MVSSIRAFIEVGSRAQRWRRDPPGRAEVADVPGSTGAADHPEVAGRPDTESEPQTSWSALTMLECALRSSCPPSSALAAAKRCLAILTDGFGPPGPGGPKGAGLRGSVRRPRTVDRVPLGSPAVPAEASVSVYQGDLQYRRLRSAWFE